MEERRVGAVRYRTNYYIYSSSHEYSNLADNYYSVHISLERFERANRSLRHSRGAALRSPRPLDCTLHYTTYRQRRRRRHRRTPVGRRSRRTLDQCSWHYTVHIDMIARRSFTESGAHF